MLEINARRTVENDFSGQTDRLIRDTEQRVAEFLVLFLFFTPFSLASIHGLMETLHSVRKIFIRGVALPAA